MAAKKSKLRRRFDAALKAYLKSIQARKKALIDAVGSPSNNTDTAYEKAALKEKDAHRAYRKATKKLRAGTRK
jgi:hypothetical protein